MQAMQADKGKPGRKVLLGAGAGVLAVLVGVGGWMGGRVYAGEPVLPFGSSEEAAEADGAPVPEEEGSQSSEEAGEAEPADGTAEYRGMTLTLPDGWLAETVTDQAFGSGLPGTEDDDVVEDWLVLYPEEQGEDCTEDPDSPLDSGAAEWAWNDTSTGCAHLKVLGPGAIRFGGAGFGPLTTLENRGPNNAYAPSGNPEPCPVGQRRHSDSAPDFKGAGEWAFEELDLGGESATWTEGSAVCLHTFNEELSHYFQQMWLLDGPQILVVDGYGLREAEHILATARW